MTAKYGTKTPERKTTGAYNPMHGDSKMKHSSSGPERELRRGLTHSEEAARAQHRKTGIEQNHPVFDPKRPDTRG
jgi:hypothetical protein